MNKRKRNRRKNFSAVENVKRRLRIRYPEDSKEAKASKYLYHLKDYHYDSNSTAILYNRESTPSQNYRGNHKIHKRVLLRACKKRGIAITNFYYETCSGKILINHKRQVLRRAIRRAEAKLRKGRNAFILATSSDRFLRNITFDLQKNPDVLPTEAEYEKLKKMTRGVPLVTVLHPDMPWKKVRSRQIRWGQRTKGNKGGRDILKRPGYKRDIREKKLPMVRNLFKEGKSPTEISRIIGKSRSTICDWIENHIL